MSDEQETIYGREFTLLEPLEKVECWNYSSAVHGNFAAGEKITVVQIYDAHHTTILCAEEGGRPTFNADGSPHTWTPSYDGAVPQPSLGYRFIVNNEVLSKAIGFPIPKQTPDLVGDILAYESGEMTEDEEEEFLDRLAESGVGNKLQGHYSSRMAGRPGNDG